MNLWEKMHGASRRRKDKALLASLERDIADGERIALRRGTRPAQADDMPVHQVTRGATPANRAAAFGRPG